MPEAPVGSGAGSPPSIRPTVTSNSCSATWSESRERPWSAERCVVALDAFTLLRHPDGLARARREAAEVGPSVDRVRAWRVLVFSLPGAPLSEGLADAIAELATIDDVEARIESIRFAATLVLREGRFEAIPELVGRIERDLATQHPGEEPWYGEIARSVLLDCPATRELVAGPDQPLRVFEHPVNQSVVLHLLALGRIDAASDRLRPFRAQLATLPRDR